MNYELKELTADDGNDIYEMLQEIPENENGFMNLMHGRTFEEYQQWLARSEAFSHATELADGWRVPTSVYWLYVDGRPVGIGKIRHFLTDRLRKEGGNAGYAVRPGERNKGYGTILLREMITEAKKLNIDRILLTIRNGNEYSLKTAAANRGIVAGADDTRHFVWIQC